MSNNPAAKLGLAGCALGLFLHFSTVRLAQLLPREAALCHRQLSHSSTVTSVPCAGELSLEPLLTGDTPDLWWTHCHLLQLKRPREKPQSWGALGLCVVPRLSEVSSSWGSAAQLQLPGLWRLCTPGHPRELCHHCHSRELQPQKWDRTAAQETQVAKQLWLSNCEGFLLLHHCYQLWAGTEELKQGADLQWNKPILSSAPEQTQCKQHQALCCTGHFIQLEEWNLKWPSYYFNYFKSHLVISPC